MRLLVLGGGGFLGYHVVVAALARGDEVTVLSRSGRAPADGVEVVTGDREGDLSGLGGHREWDAVFDTFTDATDGAPAIAATAELLRERVATYGYVSGMSVYAPTGPDVPDESAPVRVAGRESDRLQERSLAKLAGELDGTLAPTVLVPGDLDRPVQYSDARDLAAWSLEMLAAGRGGTFNAVGPGRADPLRAVLDACARAAGAGSLDDVDTVAGPEGLLRRLLTGVDEEERPLWFPEDQIPQLAIDSSRALAAGLTFRSPDELAADTLAWAREADEPALTDGAFADLEPVLLARVRDASGT